MTAVTPVLHIFRLMRCAAGENTKLGGKNEEGGGEKSRYCVHLVGDELVMLFLSLIW